MSLMIRHPREPSRLVLAWQQPDTLPDRRRWSVGELKRNGNDVTFTYFSPSELERFNSGRSAANLESAGFQGYPAFPFGKARVEFHGAIGAFMRRVPPRARTDFGDYLRQFHIEESTHLSDMGLLALTEARLPSDGFSLVDPLDGEQRLFETVVEIVGHHYYADRMAPDAAVGDILEMVPEPTNAYDRHAIRVERSGILMGYVNRLQAPQILGDIQVGNACLALSRLNGSRSKPKAFAVLSVQEKSRFAA